MEQVAVSDSPTKVMCKHCASSDIVRMGFSAHRRYQRYLCHSCERTFVDNNAPPGMKFPVVVIASSLTHFYRGSSLHAIRRKLMRESGVTPDPTNIRRWVARYTRQGTIFFAGIRPEVGQEWAVCETSIVTHMPGLRRSRTLWIWDFIDTQTRFLLASGISKNRGGLDFFALLDLAQRRANKKPKSIFADVTLHREGDFQRREATASVRDIFRPLQHRTLILQRLSNGNFVHLIVSGWAVYYNFFRTQHALEGETPAEAAGVVTTFKSWADIVGMR